MTVIAPPLPRPVPTAKSALLRRVLRRPLGLISVAFLAVLTLVAVFGPSLAPYDPNASSLQLILTPPGPEHLLGTDSAGRDVLSRLLAATQISLAGALVAVATALAAGAVPGLLAGYYKGWIDGVASWTTALNLALPGLVVLLAVRTVLGPNIWLAMFVLGILLTPSYYSLVNAAVSAVRTELYVDAARVSGLSDLRILSRHILSVVRAPIIIQSAIVMGIAIAVQSGLEFLGIGDRDQVTWGAMLNDGFASIYRMPVLLLWPSLAIVLTCIALTLLANTMRDVLERIAVVRRRKRKPATAVTGSVTGAITTLPVMTGAQSAVDAANAPETPVVHADDEHAAARVGATLLRVSDLRVAYDQAKGDPLEVVHGVSLEIRRGEVHGLIGESGSGKTQTAFAALGLLPRGGSITAGTIELDGLRLDTADERELRRIRGPRIGYIPQEPMSNLDPSFTIGSQLVEPLRTRQGMTKKRASALALELLARVGIPHPQRVFDSYPFQVSGGMAQRVLIAGAISLDPELIVADEPTTALDVTVQAEVLDLLRDLQRERGMALMLVTHNFGVVADLCDRVSVMKAGRIVETGPVRTILSQPAHPYTQSLLAAILDEGPARPPLQNTPKAEIK